MNPATRRRLLGIQGLIDPEQGERLADLAGGIPDWSVAVEIGSHTGLSTCWLGHSGARVFAVDPWADPRPATVDTNDDPFGLGSGDAVFQQFSRNLTAEGLWSRVTPLRATSAAVAATWTAPVGLLFVDALHTEEAVQADLDRWLPHLIDTGWLALHDYEPDPGKPYHGVAVVADRLAADGWTPAPLVGSLWTARRV